jgi:cell wall-associated NlpC family hydrolase
VSLAPRAGFTLSLALFATAGLGACGHTPVGGPAPAAANRAAEVALSQVGRPYRYGGNSPRGFDCSGLVQYSFAHAGVRLPRSTDDQRRTGYSVAPDRIRRGDLLFFNQEGKRASHVGIYLGNGEFVHAPSNGKQVHTAPFADPYWRKHFAGARRVDVD